MKHFCQEKYCEVQPMEKETSNYSKKDLTSECKILDIIKI